MRRRSQRIVVALALLVRAVGLEHSANAAPQTATGLRSRSSSPTRRLLDVLPVRQFLDQVGPASPSRRWRERADRRSFLVQIEPLGSGEFSGRLVVTRATLPANVRDFRARTCKEVGARLSRSSSACLRTLDPTTADDEPEAKRDTDHPNEVLSPWPRRSSCPLVPATHASPARKSTRCCTSTHLHFPRTIRGSGRRARERRLHARSRGRLGFTRRCAARTRRSGNHGFLRVGRSGLRLPGASRTSPRSILPGNWPVGAARFRLEAARASACATLDL